MLEFLPGQRRGGAGEDTPTATETGDGGQGRAVPPPMMISVAAVARAHKRPPSLRKTPVAHLSRQHRAAAAFPRCGPFCRTTSRRHQRPALLLVSPPTDCASRSNRTQSRPESTSWQFVVVVVDFTLVDRGSLKRLLEKRSKSSWIESGELVSWNVCGRETMEHEFWVKFSFLTLKRIGVVLD